MNDWADSAVSRLSGFSLVSTSATKWLEIRRYGHPLRKTPLVLVGNPHTDSYLGRIRWHGAWRQFVFEPAAGTIFNGQCLDEIEEEVERLMATRRGSHEPA